MQFEHFERLAKLGKKEAQFKLGCMYKTGHGDKEPDPDEAAFWWFEAVRQEHAEAERWLAQLFREGLGFVQEDPDAATWWFEYEHNAAADGSAPTQYYVARMYHEGLGVRQDLARARERFRDELKAAENGSAPAQYYVGRMYHEGVGVDRDLAEAAEWYARAEKQDRPGAAVALLRIGAELGDAEKQIRLANHYRSGPREERNLKRAFKWCRKAADQGHGEAQFLAGLMCLLGQGTRVDEGAAAQWWQEASKGDLFLRILMAVPERSSNHNAGMALDILEKSANRNHADIPYHADLLYLVGLMYWRGAATPKDVQAAKSCWRKAAAQGHVEAKRRLQALA